MEVMQYDASPDYGRLSAGADDDAAAHSIVRPLCARASQRTSGQCCGGGVPSSPRDLPVPLSTVKSKDGKSPLPGVKRAVTKVGELGTLVIAAPRAGSLLAPLRCAAPCQSQSRATWRPLRYRCPSQAAFVPSALLKTSVVLACFSSSKSRLMR